MVNMYRISDVTYLWVFFGYNIFMGMLSNV